MKTAAHLSEADFWTALRYTLFGIGCVVLVFTVPKAIRFFSADPIAAGVLLLAAAGWYSFVRKIR